MFPTSCHWPSCSNAPTSSSVLKQVESGDVHLTASRLKHWACSKLLADQWHVIVLVQQSTPLKTENTTNVCLTKYKQNFFLFYYLKLICFYYSTQPGDSILWSLAAFTTANFYLLFWRVAEVASKGSTSTETQVATLKEFYLQHVSVLGKIKIKQHCTLISTYLMDKESKTSLFKSATKWLCLISSGKNVVRPNKIYAVHLDTIKKKNAQTFHIYQLKLTARTALMTGAGPSGFLA